MEVWYIAHYRFVLNGLIERKEFARSTDKMLIDEHGNKHAKETQYDKAFLSWDDAKEFLLEKAESGVRYAEVALVQKRKALAEVQALTNPEEGG